MCHYNSGVIATHVVHTEVAQYKNASCIIIVPLMVFAVVESINTPQVESNGVSGSYNTVRVDGRCGCSRSRILYRINK